MSPAEHRRQHLFDDFRLPDDRLAQFPLHRPVSAGKLAHSHQVRIVFALIHLKVPPLIPARLPAEPAEPLSASTSACPTTAAPPTHTPDPPRSFACKHCHCTAK